MKKADLVREIAKAADLTQTKAADALNATLEIIKQSLKNQEDVRLVGFGSFKVTERKARMGINPQTKKAIKIPASKVAKFVPGKELKELVNSGGADKGKKKTAKKK
ncbi:MAG: HU family DNA-binding protein [Candidatus Riflebacteria bacterium]|nr:HU family DNA-binding protein [Candidatus Riflebacteria bacterium]